MKEQLLAQTPGKTNEIYFIEESSDKEHWYFRSIHVDHIDTFCKTTELKFDRFTENGVPVLVKPITPLLSTRIQTIFDDSFGPSTPNDVNATTHKLKTSFIDCESETIDVVDPVTFAVKTVVNPNYDATNNNVTVNVGNVDTLLAELTEINIKSWKSVTLSPTKPDGTFDVLFRYSV